MATRSNTLTIHQTAYSMAIAARTAARRLGVEPILAEYIRDQIYRAVWRSLWNAMIRQDQ